MTTSAHDPFSASFDSIEIDSTRAPSLAAIDRAFASMMPSTAPAEPETPGFYLVDDADGRFEIDHEMGVISLRDESILETERFAVHTARMRVVQRSGESYDMEMKLRLTGRVPQMLGAEDALFDVPESEAPAIETPASPTQITHWTHYSAATGAVGKATLERTRRNFIQREWPAIGDVFAGRNAVLSIGETLPGAISPDTY